MPRELIPDSTERKGPPEVYATLRDLIGLQYHAHGFSFLPRYAIQSLLSGRHHSKLRGRGLDFDEVRKYVSGDDIRNIDWKVTARVGTTHTKVFTEERERPVLLVADQSASMFFGSRGYLKSVVAAHLAALGAWRTLEVGDRIGGIIFGDKGVDYIAPRRDRRTVQRLLSRLAEKNQALGPANTGKGEEMLDRALRHAEQVVTHDYLVMVISDFYRFSTGMLKRIIRIDRHNDVLMIRVTDPMEQQLPDADIVFSDGPFQTSLERGSKYRTEFHHMQSEREQLLSGRLKQYGIPLLQFSTGEPAHMQLSRVVGGKAAARRRG